MHTKSRLNQPRKDQFRLYFMDRSLSVIYIFQSVTKCSELKKSHIYQEDAKNHDEEEKEEGQRACMLLNNQLFIYKENTNIVSN